MERTVLGLSLSEMRSNAKLRSPTQPSLLKLQLAGHIARKTDGHWGQKVLEWKHLIDKRSMGPPPTTWTDVTF